MTLYLWLKLIHILGAVVITGTGAGIAFFMLMASRSSNISVIYHTSKIVVLADWLFTAPAVTSQLITGLWLMHILKYSFTSTWFLMAIALFIFIGCCWLPVVYIQYRLRAIAKQALIQQALTQQPNNNAPFINTKFYHLMRLWTLLGIPAFGAILVLFYIMVFKPVSPF